MKKVNKKYLEQKRKQKDLVFIVLTIFMLFLAIKGLVVVSEYVGYATFAGEAGNIYELVVKHIIPTEDWAGVFGVAVRVREFFSPVEIKENLINGSICYHSDL